MSPHLQVTIPDGLIDALRHQRQIDMDGTEVGVSRQACDEAAQILSAVSAALAPTNGTMTDTAEMQEAEPVAWRYRSNAPKARWTVQKNFPAPVEKWDGYSVEPLYSQSDFDAMRAQRDEARDEIKRLRRLATDRAYMIDAYRAILSETGEKVAAAWDEKGVRRIHFDWGPETWSMTGEERAKYILEIETAPKVEIGDIDAILSETSESNSGDTPNV